MSEIRVLRTSGGQLMGGLYCIKLLTPHVFKSALGLRGNLEKPLHQADFIVDTLLAGEAVTSPDHTHDLEALYCGWRGLHRLKASRWSDDPLERAMIRFDDVVQVFRRSVSSAHRQLPTALQPRNGFRVRTELVGCDRGWWPVAHCRQGSAEETVRSARISAVCKHV
jgi:hypothetical protein